MKRTEYKVNKKKAVEIAMKHNGVSLDIASHYTDSELKEVLRHASGNTFVLKPNF